MSDEYAFASKSSLKLKGVENPISKKKKKKKDKKREKEAAEAALVASSSSAEDQALADLAEGSDDDPMFSGKTPSEIKFLKNKRALEMDRIRKKADMNHKEKVEKFNSYLQGLSEHYDIPKVSWTK